MQAGAIPKNSVIEDLKVSKDIKKQINDNLNDNKAQDN